MARAGHSQQHAVARAGSEDTAVAVVLLQALKVAGRAFPLFRGGATTRTQRTAKRSSGTGTLPAAYEHLSISPRKF